MSSSPQPVDIKLLVGSDVSADRSGRAVTTTFF